MFNQTKSESGKETVMKQQKLFVIVITVCALLLSLAGCASSSAFDGSSAKNADSYHLDVKTMNGTDTHTLELKQGDTLKILFETVKGALEKDYVTGRNIALSGRRNSDGIYRGGSHGRRLSHRRRGSEGKGQHSR